MSEHTLEQEFDRRYRGNKYIPYNREEKGYRRQYNNQVAHDHNSKSPQMPRRMYRPPSQTQLRGPNGVPTEAELNEMLLPPEERAKRAAERPKGEAIGRDHFRGIELLNRHRFGDDIDILRATFTRTREEVEKEKFKLIVVSREVVMSVHKVALHAPKIEKYVLAARMREQAYDMLTLAIGIKRKFYRRSMAEAYLVDADIIRECVLLGQEMYPEWITDDVISWLFEILNKATAMMGSLLRSSVV